MKIRRQEALAVLALLAAVGVVLLVNPVGFIGGPRDDGQYLEAARCWVEQGACLPLSHWHARWPVFAPMALLIQLFGESRAVVQVWPLICSVAALFLLARIGQRLFDLRTGVTAGLLLTFTPAFAIQLLRPNADTIELALILAGIACILAWRDRPHRGLAFACGLFFGLAFQVRETSIAAAIIAAGAMLALGLRPRLTHLVYAAVGFALPLAIEFAAFQFATGDFLYRRQLSLLHVRIPSSELPPWVGRTGSPILNPDYIANWHRDMGIHVHWLIDGPLNLILDAKAGYTLLLTPFLLIAGTKWIDHSVRRSAWWLLGLSAAYIAFSAYILAIDPKPRVMLVPLALGSLALALVLSSLFSRGQKSLSIIVAVAFALAGMIVTASSVRMAWADQQAQAWSAQYPHAIETNPLTSSMLTLNADVRAMPDFNANRPYAMTMSETGCREWIVHSRLGQGALSVAGEKRLRVLPDAHRPVTSLCLFRYRRPISGAEMKAALDRASAGARSR